jgi:hypothetical protein
LVFFNIAKAHFPDHFWPLEKRGWASFATRAPKSETNFSVMQSQFGIHCLTSFLCRYLRIAITIGRENPCPGSYARDGSGLIFLVSGGAWTSYFGLEHFQDWKIH